MIRLVHAEFLKLRTTRAALGLVTLLALFVILTVFLTSLLHSADRLDTASHQRDLLGLSLVAPLFALLIGLIISTGEFRHGTITPTLLATPRRPVLLGAKLIAGALLGALLVLLALGLASGLEALALGLRGIPVLFFDGSFARFTLRLLGAGLLWGALGTAIGTALRNQTMTVVGAILWVLIVEQIIHGVASSVGKFLPVSALFAELGAGNSNDSDAHTYLHTGAGVAVSIGWLVLFSVLAWQLLERRDVS